MIVLATFKEQHLGFRVQQCSHGREISSQVAPLSAGRGRTGRRDVYVTSNADVERNTQLKSTHQLLNVAFSVFY